MRRKDTRAVSPVISVVLMVSIAVAASILVYNWAMSALVLQPESFQSLKEHLVIDDVFFFQDGTVQLTTRNAGATDTKVGSIYVDGVLKYSSPQGVMIGVGQSLSFNLSDVSNAYHEFSVVTLNGFRVSGIYGPLPTQVLVTHLTTITSRSTYTTTITGTTTYTSTITSATTYTTTSTYATTTTTTSTSHIGGPSYTTTTMTITSTRSTTITTTSRTTITTTATSTSTVTTSVRTTTTMTRPW